MAEELYYFVGVILTNEDVQQHLIEAWHEAGLNGISTLDCLGVGLDKDNFRKDDVPMFLSLSNLWSSESLTQKFTFTIVKGEAALQQTLALTKKAVKGASEQSENGFIFAHPLLTVQAI